jgi:hypothetical protein
MDGTPAIGRVSGFQATHAATVGPEMRFLLLKRPG